MIRLDRPQDRPEPYAGFTDPIGPESGPGPGSGSGSGGGRIAAAILAGHVALLVGLAVTVAPTMDEPGHLVAGLAYWRSGETFLFRVNPPLVKALAALPVVLTPHREDWTRYRDATATRWEWAVAEDFARVNGRRFFALLAMARVAAAVPLAIVGGWACFAWARAMAGPGAGLVALTLWCTCPSVLGEGSLITPDLGAAATGVVAGYALWRWAGSGSWGATGRAGLAIGLACLAKFTWLPVVAAWAVLGLVPLGAGRRPGVRPAQVAAIVAIALYVINLGYGFGGTGTAIGSIDFASDLLGGPGTSGLDPAVIRENRFRGTAAEGVPMPVPVDLVRGIDVQSREFERGKWCYLFGRHQFRGWWYFYLAAAACKLPVGTLAVIALAVARRCLVGSGLRRVDDAYTLVPALAVLALISTRTGFTIYSRYALPALPFALVWASAVAAGPARDGARRAVVAGLVAWSAWSSLSSYPDCLAYLGELAGGPGGAESSRPPLIDSNLDRGQDTFRLESWCRDHPEARPLFADLETPLGLAPFAIDAEPTTAPGPPGWYAVSAQRRHARGSAWPALADASPPVARLGRTIAIYRVREPAAPRERPR